MVGRFFACPGSKTKGKTKRVENFFATCLDGGSIPPGSTGLRLGCLLCDYRDIPFLCVPLGNGSCLFSWGRFCFHNL